MNAWVQLTGWVLVHFLWQGALVVAVTACALRTLRDATAQARYLLALAALVMLAAAPVLTAVRLSPARLAPVSILPAPETSQPAIHTSSPRIIVTADGRTADVPRSTTVRSSLETVMPAIVWMWLVGVAAFLVRGCRSWHTVHRLNVAARRLAPSLWQATADRLSLRLGVHRLVRVVELADVDVPTVVGWLKPVILLPLAVASDLPVSQVEAILAHELAHVRRHDTLVNLFQTFVEAVLFYHPAVWWVSAQLSHERELCCDDVAVELCGDRIQLASALLECETRRRPLHGRMQERASTVAHANGGRLLFRIERLVAPASKTSARAPGWTVAALLALVAMAVVAGSQSTGAQSTQSASGINRSPRPAMPTVWQHSETMHFDLAIDASLRGRTEDVAAAAERLYDKVSADLGLDLSTRPRIVLRAVEASTDLPPATESADVRPVVVLTAERGESAVNAELAHGIVHAFMKEIPGADSFPLWFAEGLAEFELGEWDLMSRSRLIGLLHMNTLPRIADVHAVFETTVPYVVGHAIFDFIDDRFGRGRVRRFVAATASRGHEDIERILRESIGLTAVQFDEDFQAYLRETLAPVDQVVPALPAVADRVRASAVGAAHRFDFTSATTQISGGTVRDLVRYAYGLRDEQLSGGPAWIATERYDILTKGDGEGSRLGSPALRELLERRFGLAIRKVVIQVPADALTVAQPGVLGPALTRSATDCAARTHDDLSRVTTPRIVGVNASAFCGAHFLASRGQMLGNAVSIPVLARSLGSAVTGRPIVDRTGLQGLFDYELNTLPLRSTSFSRETFAAALREQLGLLLVPATVDAETFVIDRIERPTLD